jgi:hypothetical protein
MVIGMTTWVSFTDTLLAFIRGDIVPQSTDRYAFGCGRAHVIREDGLIPKELSWATKKREIDKEAIPAEEIADPGLLDKWKAFESLLKLADEEGRVTYQIGRYPEYLQKHPEAIWPGHSR